MSQPNRTIRIIKVLRELNISLETAIDFFIDNNIIIDKNPNAKISDEEYLMLEKEFRKPQVILKIERELNITLDFKHNLLIDGIQQSELKNYFSVNDKNNLIELNLNIPSPIYESLAIDEFKQKQNSLLNILGDQNTLEILCLSNNNFEDCSLLSNMFNLKYLDLSYNDIKNVFFLKKMASLKFLNLNCNNIVDIDAIADLTELDYLNLANNQIRDISVFQKITNLRDLDLSANLIRNIDGLSRLKSLDFLNLTSNEISDILPLQSIKINIDLLLGNNQIIDLTPLYSSLKKSHINYLTVYSNPIQYPPMKVVENGETDIWRWFEENLEKARDKIRNMKNKELDLGNLGLTDLSLLPELFLLEDLEDLILSNQYAEFKDNYWNDLKSINNHYPNNISNIPSGIKKLKNLKKLIIGGDWRGDKHWNRWRIKSIANILSLKKLEILNVSNNQITSIKGISKLVNLKVLYANNNKIKIADDFGSFETLIELYLSNNQLNKVDFLKDLVSIKALDLHANFIKDLSPIVELIKKIGISDDKWKIDTICISKNKLVNPGIEVVRNGTVAVLNQIEENNLSKLFVNDEVKLILIGNSEAGKSTFASYLEGERDFIDKIPYTLWMDEINVKIGNVKVRIFDFGGHDYFHDTHHIFFTNNTIYFLLWDKINNKYCNREINQFDKNNNSVTNETQDYPLKYWLESVKHFIKDKNASNFKFGKGFKEIDTYSSTVLVVQNKVFQNKEITHLNNKALKEKYSFIYDFNNIDIHTDRNMQCVVMSLEEMIQNSSFVGVKYPVYYKKIRDSLTIYNEKNESPIVTIEEFLDYCRRISKENLTIEFAKNIANYLNAIGVIVLNKNEDILYLNKTVLGEGIQEIFSELKDKKGEFTIKYAEELLGVNAENILKFMLDFKMIFQIKKNKQNYYVAPLYLPPNPNMLIDLLIDKNSLPSRRFFYKGFIHKNVVLDIFSKYGDKIKTDEDQKNTYYWKNGLIIREKEGLILIKFFNGNEDGGAYIDIFKLNNKVSNHFFKSLLKEIKQVNKEYKPIEMVTSNGLDFVPLKKVRDNEDEKNATFKYKKKYYNLNDFKQYFKKKNYMKKLFISYSNQDHYYKELLVRNLKPLTQFELLKPWSCEDMTSGNWNDQIQKELKDADIVVFMMSLSFITSDYILQEEVFKTFEEIKNNSDKKVICVLVKNFPWQSFGKFRKLTNLSDDNFKELQDANTLNELASNQFIPYYIQDEGNAKEKRYLRPLNKWEFEEDAYIEVIRNIVNCLDS